MKSKLLGCLGILVLHSTASASISMTYGGSYTQTFDSLVNTGTSTTLPTDWVLSETGTGGNAIYTAGTGSANGGDTYSFGSAGSTDRALGGLQSGSVVPTFGASFISNMDSGALTIDVSYIGEQWRLGATGRTDRIDFQYSLDATSLTTGTWVDVNTLDFTAPVTTGTVGALNGNLTANRTSITSSFTTSVVTEGATFWIRWSDLNATGADDGLAVDNFSISVVPEPSHALLSGMGLLMLLQRRRRGF